MRAVLILLVMGAVSANPEIIDRIAVTIGNRVLTESMIIQQIRLAAFYDNRTPDLSPASKRNAADTLAAQFLLLQEMDDTRFTVPGMAEVVEYAKEMLGQRFADEKAYLAELAERRLTDDEVKQFLQKMIRATQFIELRFQRGQQVSPEEVAAYYGKEFKQYWNRRNPGKPTPPLEEVTEDIEGWILEAKTDAANDEWLNRTKATASIRYREEVFQ